MPTALRRGFLTLLYALRSMANANGELRFHADRQPIRIQDIARAAGASEKDSRRYLDAAIRAGVVTVKGERKRGKPTLYVIVAQPWPDWAAAADHLKGTARKPGKKPAPWVRDDGSSEDRDPNQFGSPRPELTDGMTDEVRVTATRPSSGDRDPNGSGHRDPNNPGNTQDASQDGAEVFLPPPGIGPSGEQGHAPDDPRADPAGPDRATDGFVRCTRCGDPMIPRCGRTTHAHCQPVTAAERASA